MILSAHLIGFSEACSNIVSDIRSVIDNPFISISVTQPAGPSSFFEHDLTDEWTPVGELSTPGRLASEVYLPAAYVSDKLNRGTVGILYSSNGALPMKTSSANADHSFQSRNNIGSQLMPKPTMLVAAVFLLLMMSAIASAQNVTVAGSTGADGSYATI